MTLLLTVLEVVAPVFLLASLGFGWVKLGYDYPVEFVTRLAMTLAVPCLIFTFLLGPVGLLLYCGIRWAQARCFAFEEAEASSPTSP